MKRFKELLLFIVTVSLMMLSGVIIKNILAAFGIVYTPDNYYLSSIIDLLSSLLVIIVLFIIHGKTLYEDFIKLKKEKFGLLKYLGLIALGYLLLMNLETVSTIISRFIAYLIQVDMNTSDNQQKIETIIHVSPIYMAISACLLAPLEEELLFRASIRKTIKNKGVFIAVSGLFFGLMHITDNFILLLLIMILGFAISEIYYSKLNKKNKILLSVISIVISLSIFIISILIFYGSINAYIYSLNPNEILNGITYVCLGCYLAGVYVYTDNIYYTIGIHMLTNSVATIMLLLK